MNINGKILVQVTSSIDGESIGLYLVPVENVDAFEIGISKAKDQNDFDENNSFGAERVFTDEIYVETQF